MYWGLHNSWYTLPAWWSSVWENLGVQDNCDCWSYYKVFLLLSFFQLFPNSTTGVSSFCSLVPCKYLHLTLSAAYWGFRNAVRISSFLWVLHSLSIIVSGLGTSDWAGSHFGPPTKPFFFSSGSSLFPPLQFLLTGTIMGQSFDCGIATPSLTWCSVFLLKVGSIKFPLPTVRDFI
jgi:hypothetical protein